MKILFIQQLQNYNIGLGTVNNLTTEQKMLAKKCTQQILRNAMDNINLEDASINSQEDPRTVIKKTMEKTGHGCYHNQKQQ